VPSLGDHDLTGPLTYRMCGQAPVPWGLRGPQKSVCLCKGKNRRTMAVTILAGVPTKGAGAVYMQRGYQTTRLRDAAWEPELSAEPMCRLEDGRGWHGKEEHCCFEIATLNPETQWAGRGAVCANPPQ
jgi:hypothetical protein